MTNSTEQLEIYSKKKSLETTKKIIGLITNLTNNIEKEDKKNEEFHEIREKKLILADEMTRFFMTFSDAHTDSQTKKKKNILKAKDALFQERIKKYKAKYDYVRENLEMGLTGKIFKYALTEKSKSEVDSTYKLLLDEFKHFFPLLISKHYEPPTNLHEIILQLTTIMMYYNLSRKGTDFPINIDLRIDYAMAHLLALGMAGIAEIQRKGFEFDRTFKSTKSIVKKKTVKKQMIIEEYYRIDTTGMKPHTIARTIRENLSKLQRDVPSIDTIKRYLREDDLI